MSQFQTAADSGAPPAAEAPSPAVSDWAAHVASLVADVPRVIGDTGVRETGPTLVVLGGLHGNEPSGVIALQRVLARLREDSQGLTGRFVGLAGNREALRAGERFLVSDLNRMWFSNKVDTLRHFDGELRFEEEELRGLVRAIDEVFDAAPEGVFFFDVHSTSGGGGAFGNVDDTLANRAFGFAIPVPHVLGIEEELSGTLVSYLVERGITAVGFESGQHLDPRSVERAEAAIWIAMEAAGVLAAGRRPEVARGRELLAVESAGLPSVVEIFHRHPVSDEDGFRMEPGFGNFQKVDAGELLATTHAGPVVAPCASRILMPLYQARGSDGFFLIRPRHVVWLRLSALARRLQLDRFAHWLPGVSRHSTLSATFVVDRHRARWLALQFFHLLGYRRIERTEDRLLLRRRDPRGR